MYKHSLADRRTNQICAFSAYSAASSQTDVLPKRTISLCRQPLHAKESDVRHHMGNKAGVYRRNHLGLRNSISIYMWIGSLSNICCPISSIRSVIQNGAFAVSVCKGEPRRLKPPPAQGLNMSGHLRATSLSPAQPILQSLCRLFLQHWPCRLFLQHWSISNFNKFGAIPILGFSV